MSRAAGPPIASSRRRLIWLVALGIGICAAVRGGAWYMWQRPVDIQIALGQAALQDGDWAGAETHWRAALRMDPTRPEPYHLLGDLFLQEKRSEEAIALYRTLETASPRAPHTLCKLAEAYKTAGQDGALRVTARAAVKAEPRCPLAHELLGEALLRAEQPRPAIQELETALRLAPENHAIALALAEARLGVGDFAAAAQIAQSILQSDPQNPGAYAVLGFTSAREIPTPANHARAVSALKRAVALDPSRLDTVAELGRLELDAHHYAAARQDLDRAWNGGMQNESTAYSLALVDRDLGDKAESDRIFARFKWLSDLGDQRRSLQQQLAVKPGDDTTALQLAVVEAKLGDARSATRLLNGVLQAHGQNAEELTPRQAELAAEVYEAAGQTQTARALRQQAARPQGRSGKSAGA